MDFTLEEAAGAMTARTGEPWTVRRVVWCAAQGEVSIGATMPTACTMRRIEPKEGEPDEFPIKAGAYVPNVGADVAKQMLLRDIGHLTEWPGLRRPTSVDEHHLFGEWVQYVAWRIADGDTAPEVRMDACRISASSLEALMAAYAPIPCIEPANEEPAIAGAGETAPAAPNSGNATAIRCGSNPASVYRAWIAEQAGKLVQAGDTRDALGKRIYLLAEERNYRNESGDPIGLGTITRWIPVGTTGGREKNGRKPPKSIRPAKSN